MGTSDERTAADTTLCVVQARMGSSRLPGKVLMDLAGRPLLRFMLDRLRPLAVDHLVVATSTLDRDDPVADAAAAAGVEVVRGDEADVLSRFITALDRHPAATVVRLTADCPLSDPAVVADVMALRAATDADYASNVLPRTFPKGLDVEVVTAAALRVADAEATGRDREHVLPFLYRHPERFRLANLRSGLDLGHERWTVDTADDLAHIRRLAAAMGDDLDLGWRELLALAPITDPVAEPGLHLRLATIEDAPSMLTWRNQPDAIRTSRSGTEVDPAGHVRWMQARIDDPATRLWIGVEDGRAVGYVRLQVEAARGLVSVAVAPGERGRGLGHRLIELAQAELRGDVQVDELLAEIDLGNEPSRRAFRRAGFELVDGPRPDLGTSGSERFERWAWKNAPS